MALVRGQADAEQRERTMSRGWRLNLGLKVGVTSVGNEKYCINKEDIAPDNLKNQLDTRKSIKNMLQGSVDWSHKLNIGIPYFTYMLQIRAS